MVSPACRTLSLTSGTWRREWNDDVLGRGRRRDQRRARLPVVAHVLGREDGYHARPLPGGGHIDAQQAGMSVVAAHEGGVQHAGDFHVVHEQRLPGQQPWIFVSQDAFSDHLLGHDLLWVTLRRMKGASINGGLLVGGLHLLCCQLDGIDDMLVTGAAAQIARNGLADLFLARVGILRPGRAPPSSGSPACRNRTAGRAPPGMPPGPGAAGPWCPGLRPS